MVCLHACLSPFSPATLLNSDILVVSSGAPKKARCCKTVVSVSPWLSLMKNCAVVMYSQHTTHISLLGILTVMFWTFWNFTYCRGMAVSSVTSSGPSLIM